MFIRLRSAVVVAIWASIVPLAGCAFGTRQPTLTYPPPTDADGRSVAHAAASEAHQAVEIVLYPFVDQRSDKKAVGTVRNALGMRTADVIPTNSVSEWVTEAVAVELQEHGYTVIRDTSQDSSKSGTAHISGEILNVFCDMYFSYTGQVSLLAKATRDGKELFNKHYAGEGSAGLAVAATSESYAHSLALALSAALKRFVSDLDDSLAAK